ncbi:MAG: amino acid adenylation domain-containing protein [Betaproteobacteria bacterium]
MPSLQPPAPKSLLYEPARYPGSPVGAARGASTSPLSFSQQRLWMLDGILPNRSVYTVAQAYRIVGRLNPVALQRALGDIVARHDVLRTRFALTDDGPVQVIVPAQPLELSVVDLGSLDNGLREPTARRIAHDEAQAPFDLESGMPLRVRLLRLRDAEHWLLMTLHHIVTDGWSTGVLWRELSALYLAHCRGEANPLPPLPVRYADFSVWQRQWLQGEELERQLAYWKPALADLPVLDLPTDRPRPAIASHRGACRAFELGTELTRSLKVVSRGESSTLFMTLLAAFQVLLYRYTGQEDIAVGVPTAGRNRPELESLIGFFVNTLVMRGDLSGEPTFRAFLARVRARALDAYAHLDLPFEKLVEELHPARDLSRNPLFQAALVMRNMPRSQPGLHGLHVEPLADSDGENAKFDLHLSVTEVADVLQMRLEYATDLFDAATIERLIGHWQVLLEGIVADPGQSIACLPLLSAQERDHLQDGSNATSAQFPRGRCIHALFEAQVLRTPEAVAAVFADEQLTYGELNARANRLAHHLRGLGAGPEVLVGLCVERSLDLVVGLLGILKAGAAYVPLDPGYPAQRLAFMLDDTKAPVLVTQQRLLALLPAAAAKVVCLDRDGAAIAGEPSTNPAGGATEKNLAYVIYTSGSTGQPKGVMIEHRSVVNHFVGMVQRFSLGSEDCVLQSAPIGFDQSIWQILVPLVSGGRVALPEPDAHRSADELADAIRRHRVTVLRTVPTMLSALLRGPRLDPLHSLRLVIAAGEVLENDVAAEFAAQSRAVLVNAYGPTETTFVASLWECPGAEENRRIPIGAPLPNMRIHVLDRHDQRVPIGVQGELCIGGEGVGRGYWRQPELTARSFVRDPFNPDPQARMFRSGDLACLRPDGRLEFLGRRDHQIKLRGVRIELGEIETVLASHAGVIGAVVVAREGDADDRRLIGYVTTAGKPPPTTSDLRGFLRARLPEFMIPAAFVRLNEFPTASTGKIDRLHLPPPDAQSESAASACAAPRNDLETQLAAIFSDILGVGSVGIFEDFFALGGHSLLVMRVLAAVKAGFAITVRPREFFVDATVAGLAKHLDPDAQGAFGGAVREASRGSPMNRHPRVPSRQRITSKASANRSRSGA